jgi:glucose-6-phosphate 1-epimerase
MSQIRTITHSVSGASFKFHEFGATVTSFKTAADRECLFVSRDAKLDGSKAVRGGIPLVFPQFGQPDKSMPQHGFLRNNYWKVDESSAYDNESVAGISLTLDLKDVKNSRGGKWDENTKFDCSCVFSIKVEANKMTTELEIKNTSSSPFEFQTLQHTYFRVEGGAAFDPSQCYVKGLEGYSVSDKITNEEYTLGSDPIVLVDNVDRVYTPLADDKDVVSVDVGVGGGKVMKLTASGVCNSVATPVSCVVWNPFKEKAAAMGDFGDEQVGSTLPFLNCAKSHPLTSFTLST